MDHTESVERRPVLCVKDLGKHLGNRRILDGISLEVYPGEIFGFLGPNGSGKTTTIKLILGLLSLETGEIFIDGHGTKDDFEAAMACVGGIVENPEMYRHLTGYENLAQYARMYTPHISASRIDEVVSLVGLGDRIRDKVAKYSLGMRQRLGVAQALLAKPKLLVLDEPTNGLDPAGIHDLRELLRRVAREEGTAVFVSSHLLSEMDQMCDRVGILEGGTVVGVYSMKELHGAVGETDRVKLRFSTVMPDRLEEVVRGMSCADGETGIRATLLDRAPDNESEEAGSVFVTVSVARSDARELIRLIAISDTEFHAILPVRRTLEDAYLSMTRPIGGGKPTVGDTAMTVGDTAITDGDTAMTVGAENGTGGIPPVPTQADETAPTDGVTSTDETAGKDGEER